MMQEIEQKVASDLLDDIQYNLIHFVDCLREQKNEELAGMSLNFLTALLSISMGKSIFIPIEIDQKGTLSIGFHTIFPAKQTLNKFLDSKQQLLASLDILSPNFTSNDKIMFYDNLKRIEESKVIFMKPPFANYGLTSFPHPSSIKSDPFLAFGKYKQQKNLYLKFGMIDAMLNFDFGPPPHRDLQSAYLFPCFQSFCTNYQNERSNFSKIGKSISQSLFSQKSRPPEMYQLIESGSIITFREVMRHAFKHQDHNNRSADILKKYYGINTIPEILSLLEKTILFPKDLNQIVIEYISPPGL